jgi:ribosome-binding factor A
MSGGSGKVGRSARVAQALRENLADLIPHKIGDPRLAAAGMISINHVELNKDLSVAKVYVSFLGGRESDAAVAIEVLSRAAGRLRGPLARRIHLARAPELRFFPDGAGEMSARIHAIVQTDEERARADRQDDPDSVSRARMSQDPHEGERR